MTKRGRNRTGTRRPTARPEPAPRRKMPPDHIGVLLAAVGMMALGWGGLALLITRAEPRIGAELWSFFLLLHLGVTGTVLPIVRYINVRLTPPDSDPPAGGVVVRQSVWVGLYVVIVAWLQILRVLSGAILVFLPVVFVMVEWFMRTQEINDDA